MSSWTLILRGAAYYWRTHLGVLLGAALGAMVLTGALLVGDSVKATLRAQALARVGRAQSAMLSSEQFFRDTLAAADGTAPALLLRGSVAKPDGTARINQAQVVGGDERFSRLSPGGKGFQLADGELALNTRAAAQLNAKVGDPLIVRIEKPTAFSRDAPLSGEEDAVVAIRARVARIVDDADFGRFSLQASQTPPLGVFLPLKALQERLQLAGRANVLLARDQDAPVLQAAANAAWQLPDAGLVLRPLPEGGLELRTDRVFLDPAVVTAVSQATPKPRVEALTYFVNELRSGEKATPYSMVTAVDAAAADFLPKDLREDEMVINQWLADDLGAAEGAKISLKYFVMAPGRRLREESREFRVKAILPMDGPQMNTSWMPDFPGLADEKNCRDWKPGFAFDSTRIRDKDQQYWEQYRGTPKAFVALKTGQAMWSNRWGNLTSIRWPGIKDPAAIAVPLRAGLSLGALGFRFLPLRSAALAATDAPVDFGQLFIGFSLFLLAAAAILTGLVFVFSLEQRNAEAGLLLALGLRPRQVRRLLLAEGLVLAALGCSLGIAGAVLYTNIVLRALSTVWSGAVGGATFAFAAQPLTLAEGFFSALAMALLAMWLASRRQLRHSAHDLLSALPGADRRSGTAARGRPWSLFIGIAATLGALAIAGTARPNAPDSFFSAGALLLIGGVALVLFWLRKMDRRPGELDSLNQLAVRNTARRRGRGLATIAVLASGVFMVVAVDAFRQGGGGAPAGRESGTGGFALLGESALPLYADLNGESARDAYGLDSKIMEGVQFVPLRVRDGDDASCLNLNRALQPRFLGVDPQQLAGRGAFRFSGALEGGKTDAKASPAQGWALLGNTDSQGIPAVADEATLEWALQKKVGDRFEAQDETGQPFQVHFVGALAGSVLQGSILISEKDFIAKFPGQSGYRFFLIDAPQGRVEQVSRELSRGLADRGFEVIDAQRRLEDFQAVENTYLSIFQALGGLGLLLGTVGLAIVVARNTLERRAEFGLLEAVGFRASQLRQLVFREHRWLIAFGILTGTAGALLGIWPSFAGQPLVPFERLLLLLVVIGLGALFWTWLAVRVALRGSHLNALRNE